MASDELVVVIVRVVNVVMWREARDPWKEVES